MTAFPNLLGVGGQSVSSTAYRWRGETRRDTPHTLFQLTLEGHGVFVQGDRRYNVNPGYGFLCQSHNPGIGYHYPKGAHKPWTFLYVCFSGRSAMSLADDLVRRHGPIFAMDTSDPFVAQMLSYADLAPEGSLISSVAECANQVSMLLHRLLVSAQIQTGMPADIGHCTKKIKPAEKPDDRLKGDHT